MINFLFKSGYFKVFLICWLSYSTSLIGQDGVQFVCPSDELLKEHINSDPSINQMRILYEDNYRKYVEKERFQKTLENVYTLPVVLHIVHSGQPIGSIQNPSDQSLQDLISESNMRFRHMHADA